MKAKGGIRSDGFTLLELLVTIAILTLLVTILLPTLDAALDYARGAECLNNLRNISVAALLYAADHEDLVPRGNRPYWFLVFLPYLRDDAARGDFRRVRYYRCPNYPDEREVVHYVVSDFGFCGELDVTGYSIDEATPLTSIEIPWQTIYESGWWRPVLTGFGDTMICYHDVWKPSHLANSNEESLGNGRRVANARHKDGCNAAFFDGHSEWVRASTMTVDMWRDYWGPLRGRRFNKK
jgi:prepilin-type N-terminal cleavage/methylation domain-containing protein/prepilin-type processing-associated H-X9-DG protein